MNTALDNAVKSLYHTFMAKSKKIFIPTMMRLSPRAKALLESASSEQRRSQASIIEHLILTHLYRYSEVEDRLNMMLARKEQG